MKNEAKAKLKTETFNIVLSGQDRLRVITSVTSSAKMSGSPMDSTDAPRPAMIRKLFSAMIHRVEMK